MRAYALGAVAWLALWSGVTTARAQPCAEALCGVRSLKPFFDTLQARSAIDGAPPVHILQIGDSHSAGDAITGAWRDILQARYGSGGRGVLPPGDPYWGFQPHGVHITQTEGWRVEATFGPASPPAGDPVMFGLSGFRLTSAHPGAAITLTAEPREAFSRLIVCGVTGPGAGDVNVTVGASAWRMPLSGPDGAACGTFEGLGRQTAATLTAAGSPVTLLSWATFAQGGVAVSNLGVVGAQLRHFARADDRALGEELRAYAPDLIVLAFGTNEGFGARLDAAAYESGLRAQIARLRRLSGGVPLLILGAPDAGTNRRELAHNGEPGDGSPVSGGWFPPPALARIRDSQRRVALEEGAAFWDWGGRMGGPGAAETWVNLLPPLMRRDHVHYTSEGGAEIARLLQDDLDQALAGPAPPP